MSIRRGLLALLERSPMYGYQLRHEFERSTGSTWPLNVGQVYTTLARLERDGLVEQTGESDAKGKVVYRLTDAGHTEVTTWFAAPSASSSWRRDELAIKVALALTTPGVDVRTVVETHRTAMLRRLRELTRLKSVADDTNDTARQLVLDSMIFRAEAEVRWLDHSESRLGDRDGPLGSAVEPPELTDGSPVATR